MDGKESPVYPHSDLESMSQHTSQNDVVMARTWSPHEDGRPDGGPRPSLCLRLALKTTPTRPPTNSPTQEESKLARLLPCSAVLVHARMVTRSCEASSERSDTGQTVRARQRCNWCRHKTVSSDCTKHEGARRDCRLSERVRGAWTDASRRGRARGVGRKNRGGGGN